MPPWSARKFANGEIDTWPFEHEYIEAYRGTSREIFFPKEHSSSMKNLPGGRDKKLASVLNTRYLIPMNNNGNTGETSFQSWKKWYISKLKDEEGLNQESAERVWKEFLKSGKENRDPKYDEKLDTREPGNFFAPRNVVEQKGYYRPESTESILLKVYIPTQLVTVINRLKNQDNIRCDNLELMKRHYTKEEFREQCRIATQVQNNEQLQYATADLNLKHVKAIEDKECSSKPVSVSEYVKWLKKKCVWEMDQFSISVKAHNSIEEELNFLKEFEYSLEKVKYYLKQIDAEAHNVKETTDKIKSKYGDKWTKYRESRTSELSSTTSFLETLDNCLTGNELKGPGYPQTRKQLYQQLEKQTEYFSSRNNSEWSKGVKNDLETHFAEQNVANTQELFRNIDSYLKTVQRIEEEIENIRTEEKKRGNQDNWSEEEYKKERRIEHKIESRLAKEIEQLPNLKNLEEEIKKKRKKAEKEYQKLNNGENPSRTNYLGIKV